MPPGLARFSTKIAFTRGVSARRKFSVSVGSTKWHFQPSFLNDSPNCVSDRRPGRPVANDPAINPAPRQLAAQPAEFDLRTAVHDNFDPGPLGRGGCGIVANAELHPHHLGADRNRVLDDGWSVTRRTEDID